MRLAARGGRVRGAGDKTQGKFCISGKFVFFLRAMMAAGEITVLAAPDWRERARLHLERARRHTGPARARRDRRQRHPMADFLFEYYPFPFSLLDQWQPQYGQALEWGDDAPRAPFNGRCYRLDGGVLMADPRLLGAKERVRLGWILELLEATRDRAPNFACHGLHEWAMVYRGKEVRHERTLKFRLSQAEIDEVVETRAICCSHHDAFRFFAPEARPLNHLQPTLDDRISLEQPACLHANMDLYKWAAKAMPWAGSELLLDCFELAAELRDLDMRASPYDVSGWGLDAVPVETPEGRRMYENEQRLLAGRARPLRGELTGVIRRVLEAAGGSDSLPAELLAQGLVE